jgi:hypothetical protein
MKPDNITFANLEKLLFKLGFTAPKTSLPQKIFQHKPSDTLIVLPPYQPQDILRPIHLLSTQKLLVERDLISQAAFEGALEKIDRAPS